MRRFHQAGILSVVAAVGLLGAGSTSHANVICSYFQQEVQAFVPGVSSDTSIINTLPPVSRSVFTGAGGSTAAASIVVAAYTGPTSLNDAGSPGLNFDGTFSQSQAGTGESLASLSFFFTVDQVQTYAYTGTVFFRGSTSQQALPSSGTLTPGVNYEIGVDDIGTSTVLPITFTITPAPEPAGLAMLSLSLPLAARRRAK